MLPLAFWVMRAIQSSMAPRGRAVVMEGVSAGVVRLPGQVGVRKGVPPSRAVDRLLGVVPLLEEVSDERIFRAGRPTVELGPAPALPTLRVCPAARQSDVQGCLSRVTPARRCHGRTRAVRQRETTGRKPRNGEPGRRRMRPGPSARVRLKNARRRIFVAPSLWFVLLELRRLRREVRELENDCPTDVDEIHGLLRGELIPAVI
jgi:hypothetical protein